MYVCVRASTCVYLKCVIIHVHTIFIYIYTYVYMYACIHVYMMYDLYMYNIYIYIYVYAYIHIHTHTHTHGTPPPKIYLCVRLITSHRIVAGGAAQSIRSGSNLHQVGSHLLQMESPPESPNCIQNHPHQHLSRDLESSMFNPSLRVDPVYPRLDPISARFSPDCIQSQLE